MQETGLREEFMRSERIYSGKIINVENWQVTLPDGKPASREIVLHRGASAIVAISQDRHVTLVHQHRVAIDEITWEIPAGKLDSTDEDPLSAAKRELEEETGLQAARWQKLICLYTTPGFCNEKIHIYLATELSRTKSHTDEDEFLSVADIPLDEAVELISSGHIRDSKTVAGILLAQRVLHSGQQSSLFASSPIQRMNSSVSSLQMNSNGSFSDI